MATQPRRRNLRENATARREDALCREGSTRVSPHVAQ